jgi:peptidoglycan/xylan/chitin deacetylase (PgdA/CDA1 family)
VPSFREHVDTLARWRSHPGREWVEVGVALTFDDGPDPESTPAILDVLDAGRARATFFLVGEQLLTHHELGREVARRGHAIGLHGFHHVEGEEGADLLRGLDAIEAAAGVRPRLYRPPYGRMHEATYAACRELGLEAVYWSAWGADWEDIGPERIVELVRRDLVDGAIVLLHDSARYGHRPSAKPTVDALPQLLETIEARGLVPAVVA